MSEDEADESDNVEEEMEGNSVSDAIEISFS
jgi:hypothetical protein